MADFRFDPVFSRWTCIAEDRVKRPYEFQHVVERRKQLDCPFCIGMEEQTPPAMAVYPGDANTKDSQDPWLVRVVPNKYPAIYGSGVHDVRTHDSNDPNGFNQASPYLTSEGGGLQEVIVLSPRHLQSLSELNTKELQTAFQAFQDRIRLSQSQPELRHTALFMNCRAAAGASIEHVHAQLIGAAVCTEQVESRFANLAGKSDSPGVFQELVDWELAEQSRVLESNDDFAVFCPFASRVAYQTWIAPRQNTGHFGVLSVSQCRQLAELCQRWVINLETLLGNPAYNLIFHLPPHELTQRCNSSEVPWFIEIFPRIHQLAGFETASECWINTTSPESAAIALREIRAADIDTG